LDSKSYKIIGVLPAGTFDRTWAVIWLPLTFSPADMTRNYHWLSTIARLEPGVTLEQARAQMDTIGASSAALYPDSNKGWGVTVDQVVAPQLRRSLWVLLAAVGAVLLIGCANLANLTLARGTDREQEIAIRSALGAGRFRLIRQLLTENMFLGVLGGVAGLALGDALMHGIKLWLSADMLPPEANVRMDYGVFLFTMVIGILTGILFGLAPALSSTHPDLTGSLKEGGRTTVGLTRRRMRTALVLAEVAMSFVLLAGASLLIRSFNRCRRGVAGSGGALGLLFPSLARGEGCPPDDLARSVVRTFRHIGTHVDAAMVARSERGRAHSHKTAPQLDLLVDNAEFAGRCSVFQDADGFAAVFIAPDEIRILPGTDFDFVPRECFVIAWNHIVEVDVSGVICRGIAICLGALPAGGIRNQNDGCIDCGVLAVVEDRGVEGSGVPTDLNFQGTARIAVDMQAGIEDIESGQYCRLHIGITGQIHHVDLIIARVDAVQSECAIVGSNVSAGGRKPGSGHKRIA
jgi:FtsX-like permease family